MQFWTEFSTKRIFGGTKQGQFSKPEITLETARNAYLAFQVVFREVGDITFQSVDLEGFEQLEKMGASCRIYQQKYRLFRDGISYPDELAEIPVGTELDQAVPAHCTQSLWTDLFLPGDVIPGTYRFSVNVKISGGTYKAAVTVNVHEEILPDSNKGRFDHEYFFKNRDKDVTLDAPKYSEKWWDYLRNVAKLFRELRNNYIYIHIIDYLIDGGSRQVSEDQWEFRWELFDKVCQLFLDEGAAKGFTITAIIQSVEGKFVSAVDSEGKYTEIPTMTPEGEKWLSALFGALGKHLEENGWTGLFRSHIEDEPHGPQVWNWAREIIRKANPVLLCGEPLDMMESAYEVRNHASWMVPRINVYEEDPAFFQRQIKENGLTLWLYSCCFPEEGWWLNKFIDLPFIRSRIMEWQCVASNCKGFLHWGFNFYDCTGPAYGCGPDARFKGDGHIVYPDPENNSYRKSIRFLNTRDGLQDAELLLMKAEKDPEAVKKAIGKVATNFYTFSDCPDNFNEALKEVFAI